MRSLQCLTMLVLTRALSLSADIDWNSLLSLEIFANPFSSTFRCKYSGQETMLEVLLWWYGRIYQGTWEVCRRRISWLSTFASCCCCCFVVLERDEQLCQNRRLDALIVQYNMSTVLISSDSRSKYLLWLWLWFCSNQSKSIHNQFGIPYHFASFRLPVSNECHYARASLRSRTHQTHPKQCHHHFYKFSGCHQHCAKHASKPSQAQDATQYLRAELLEAMKTHW